MAGPPEPDGNCPLCPRLADFRESNRASEPTWHNAPVPAFGSVDAELLVVGLAPGLRGANRTGRPFTGDAAGALLYPTLREFGFARGRYSGDGGDRLRLVGCRITNAVRCVPPGNRPRGPEIRACRPFLAAELAALGRVRAIVALGTVAHDAVLDALGIRRKLFPFRHGAARRLRGSLLLADSYHCSRYNVNTGRLTETMFRDVFASARAWLDGPPEGGHGGPGRV